MLCRVLGVSESGYHARRTRKPSKRKFEDAHLSVKVREAFVRSRKSYGSPRVTVELKDQGLTVGRHRVARIMRSEGLCARPKRRFKKTTNSRHSRPIAANLVSRRFAEIASAPNKLWVSDLTYVWTAKGWLYLCVFLDVYSRKVVGWSLAEHMEADLVTDALEMTLALRRPEYGLIVHSDRGSQYASDAVRAILERQKAIPSMSRRGDCWDNAIAESFFSTIKTELIERQSWISPAHVQPAIIEWIEGFYNSKRRHSAIGYKSPIDYEDLTRESQAA